MNKLVRINGATQILQMSKSNVWKLTKEGTLKSYKLSEKVTVWKVEELESFINSKIGA